ncbi:4-(cytidine 5'-diphospho)-2-C-methyl-D-erythritol kinase [Faecalicoccus acidiformans]|uniref:4-diphosphocytidyl-2-C-methyl-D-erythritol kinase n=1 Tax=Faecalicoccus acidiformans TaxID=915173 RepID=A0ABS2FNI9_9FIRM|nr:4-(cytidine 5'-diphospho)-2-C-methyl-D-erythritol kinase [Faecalicoccus acidiformans]MBM6831192.1 4-(cytidine 5'-diphospho)-2-C-methyl-D-erythritol kinase [Faecalicoccus acidiformans]
MKVQAQAKVNLALDVIGKRNDGYHELDMIMAPISLYNDIEIDIHPVDQITCDGGKIPDHSTIHKTLALLRKEIGLRNHYAIHVLKRIPDQAGLAGSSADAAAVFRAVMAIEGIDLELVKQLEFAKQIGADVPFCLVNRLSRVQGIGEKIRVLPQGWKLSCLIVKPSYGISTPEAFERWHAQAPVHVDVDAVEDAIQNQDFVSLCERMGNALEKPAFQMRPELRELKQKMEALGFDRVMMSGSGSSLMGFFHDPSHLKRAKELCVGMDCFVEIVTIG